MQAQTIGPLSGTLLLFGGVYSNLDSLRQLRSIAEAHNLPPEQVICTGDIVGYCAEPEACVQHIKDWGIHSIAGNVEVQLRSGEEDCGCDFKDGSRCDVFSRHWYPYAQKQMSADSLEWMNDLPLHLHFEYQGSKMVVVHGSYSEVSGYMFASTDWKTKLQELRLANADVAIAGHCGLPFSQGHKKQAWLNPGVIGMPANDGTPRVWYALLHPEGDKSWRIEHKSFTYNHERSAQLMAEHQLPAEYALTLSTGLWDNCEILPPEETALQGQALQLGSLLSDC